MTDCFQVWQQFTTRVSLNGTVNDFWPATLTKNHTGLDKRRRAGEPGQNVVSAELPELAKYLAYSKNDKGGFAIDTPEKFFQRELKGHQGLKTSTQKRGHLLHTHRLP